MRKPIRAVAIDIEDKHILLIHRANQSNEYCVASRPGLASLPQYNGVKDWVQDLEKDLTRA